MPDPHDTLAIFAEIAIALAGFSGIIIAFGRRSAESLSTLEYRRLSNLFTLSGMVLAFSLTGVSLLHVDGMNSNRFWSWCSAAVFILGTPWLIRDLVIVSRLEKAEKSQINILLFTFFDSMAAVLLILQAVNWFLIKAPWPFFLALTLTTAGAFQQFILLVGMGIRHGSESDPTN